MQDAEVKTYGYTSNRGNVAVGMAVTSAKNMACHIFVVHRNSTVGLKALYLLKNTLGKRCQLRTSVLNI